MEVVTCSSMLVMEEEAIYSSMEWVGGRVLEGNMEWVGGVGVACGNACRVSWEHKQMFWL